ncbi:MAG: spherulation-specific family 4 protein [Deltaproteobacteria bacterium]|nr:spherulation-specific family 4 protein [Deltaproteobacteria bacterium]
MRFRMQGLGLAAAMGVFISWSQATPAAAAIASTNTTNDATTVTYAFQYSTPGTWYRVFIDNDRNAGTGFPTAGIGANFMLENGTLFRHVGPGWNWATVGAVTYSNGGVSTASWVFSRSSIGETNCTSETADVVFQVGGSGGQDTSARLVHSYIPCASKLINDRTLNNPSIQGNVGYRIQYSSSTWSQFQVFIDTDRSASTGYGMGGIGANYLVENATLFRHTGASSSWTWTQVTPVSFSHANNVVNWSVPRGAMGETASNESADIVYRVQSSSANAALPKRTHIYFGGTSQPPAATAGTIVPLYTYPTDASWSAIASAKRERPSVAVMAIVNPASGPGTTVDSNYTIGINNLRAAGIKVLGYVATGYAARSEATVQMEMDRWRSFYPGVEGVFFDEMSNVAGQENYYRRQDTYARSKGFNFTVGNPGTDTRASYVGVVNTIIVYESAGTAPLPTWYTGHARENFAVIPYRVPSLNAAYVATARQSVGFIYMTNDDLPNPWDSLPSYFPALLTELAR